MVNMFEKDASHRESELKKIEKMLAGLATEDEKRIMLSLSLMSDKNALKIMNAKRVIAIAAVIHECVQGYIEEVSE